MCKVHFLHNVSKLFYVWHLKSVFHRTAQFSIYANFPTRALICDGERKGHWGSVEAAMEGKEGFLTFFFIVLCQDSTLFFSLSIALLKNK